MRTHPYIADRWVIWPEVSKNPQRKSARREQQKQPLHASCLEGVHSYLCVKPEYAGKLNFYLSAADDLLRTAPDAPTLGLLLCESRGEPIIAEYALRDIAKPIGVSTYRVTRQLPEPLRAEVPSIEDLKNVVEKLRSEMNELQAEQRLDNSSSRNPSGKPVRRK